MINRNSFNKVNFLFYFHLEVEKWRLFFLPFDSINRNSNHLSCPIYYYIWKKNIDDDRRCKMIFSLLQFDDLQEKADEWQKFLKKVENWEWKEKKKRDDSFDLWLFFYWILIDRVDFCTRCTVAISKLKAR